MVRGDYQSSVSGVAGALNPDLYAKMAPAVLYRQRTVPIALSSGRPCGNLVSTLPAVDAVRLGNQSCGQRNALISRRLNSSSVYLPRIVDALEMANQAVHATVCIKNATDRTYALALARHRNKIDQARLDAARRLTSHHVTDWNTGVSAETNWSASEALDNFFSPRGWRTDAWRRLVENGRKFKAQAK